MHTVMESIINNYDGDDDDVQWFNVLLKADIQFSPAHSAKVKTDMPKKNEKKQLESVKSIRWVER